MKNFLFLLFCALCLASCIEQKKENQSSAQNISNQPLKIVCTTGMIGDLVDNIASTEAEIYTLMGVGVDPHLYKPTQKDVSMLSEADIIFYNGLHLEGKMTEILQKINQEKPTVPLAEAITKNHLRKVSEGTYDPHVWMNVDFWRQIVPTVVENLSSLKPQNTALYNANAEKYTQKLEQLHQTITQTISEISMEHRILITSHDAFYYFGKAYNIEVRPLQGISTISEAGISDINQLVDFIVDKKVKAVFVESSISPQAINAVLEGARQKGADVEIGGTLYADAMGKENTLEGTYIGMLTYNANTIAQNLK